VLTKVRGEFADARHEGIPVLHGSKAECDNHDPCLRSVHGGVVSRSSATSKVHRGLLFAEVGFTVLSAMMHCRSRTGADTSCSFNIYGCCIPLTAYGEMLKRVALAYRA